ncbi:5-formyltetrahydrofolate cyclo-ligase [Colwellia sp. MEBiC06753]
MVADSQQVNNRQLIRQQVRERRSQLSATFQAECAESLVKQIEKSGKLTGISTIALYLANDGELDTLPLIRWAWQQNIQVVLPVLHPVNKGFLIFLRYQKDSVMQLNQFNIPEPKLDVTNLVPLSDIDVICTPLVAFDNRGHRLGMGGGFYDRTLGQLNNCQSTANPNPSLIGLAHDCQELVQIPTESWDVPLPVIITPSRIILANNKTQ